MRKIIFVPLLVLLAITGSWAQKTGPVVFTVGGDTVYGGEFERVYSKNNDVEANKPSMDELEEYLDLYVKFKLKVKEAYALQMDTNRAYIGELRGYRKQLAQPYLTDKQVTEQLVKEAYDRYLYEVRASNLMVHLDKNASPEDTLAAYKRIQNWQNMLANGEVDFAQLAHDSSTDESARYNYGDLGYFSVFNMIYPFENYAYNTSVGEISPIFRTQYGYHILKVVDKRPNRGERKVAHVLIRTNNEAEINEKKEQIDAVYNAFENGTPWDELVNRYTQDFSSRGKAGEMRWFGSINAGDGIPPAFREKAYTLDSIGEVSKPFLTEAGWHIIKLVGKRGTKSLDEMRENIKFKIARDQRGELNEQAVQARIREENNYVEHSDAIDAFINSLSKDLRFHQWEPTDFHKSDEVLFTIGDKKYTYNQFTAFVYVKQPYKTPLSAQELGRNLFEEWANEQNKTYEEDVLEDKYPKFHYLMQEYRDGILLFELTSQMVWEKATKDTAGLMQFFENHRDDYRWDKRADISVYSCANQKVAKKVKKYVKRGKKDDFILEKLNKKNALSVQISYDRIEYGVDTMYNDLTWEEGLHEFEDGTVNEVLVKVTNVIPAGEKELSETRGPVTSDYQDYLEEKWIEKLRQKYPVEVNEAALDQLFK